MTATIDLENVGPIEHLSIPIPEKGGLVVLSGGNGRGKSHAINAVESLYSKDSRKQLRHSDGTPSGKVTGLGVTIRLGRSNTVKGELVCEALDGRVDPSMLVDPGLKDPMAADTKRLTTLVRLAGIRVSPGDWAAAIPTDAVELEHLVSADPVETADRIRRKLHDAALARERIAENKLNESRTLENAIAGIDLQAESDRTKLQSAFEHASAYYGKAIADRENRLKHQRDKLAARELLMANAARAIDLESAEHNVLATKGVIEDKIGQAQQMEQTIVELQSRQKLLFREIEQSEALLKQQQERVELAKEQANQIAQWTAIVEGDELEPVTDAEIAHIEAAKNEAAQAMERGETIRRAQLQADQAARLAAESEDIAETAAKLRDLARSTDSILEQALVTAGFGSIKVYEGRLCVESDRGLEPFSELSHGERWRYALDLAAAGLPKGSVLPVCQEAFESLDTENRRFVHNLAVERGLVIITAEATEGDLRAEVLSDAN